CSAPSSRGTGARRTARASGSGATAPGSSPRTPSTSWSGRCARSASWSERAASREPARGDALRRTSLGPVTPARPFPHPSGATPPDLPASAIPHHVAIVMDGNGRWAKQRGLPRTEGHTRGEAALLDVVAGAIEIGVRHVTAYAFSTENWKRSPEEVRFLMGFNRDVIRRRRDQM